MAALSGRHLPFGRWTALAADAVLFQLALLREGLLARGAGESALLMDLHVSVQVECEDECLLAEVAAMRAFTAVDLNGRTVHSSTFSSSLTP